MRHAFIGGAAAVGFATSGLLDIAVFHLLLQWHHFVMLPDESAMLRSDGWLMLALLAISLAGLLALWSAARSATAAMPAARVAWGGALIGAGAFNGGDVLLDHFVLGLHQLNEETTTFAPDLAWLVLSAAVVGVGVAMVRSAGRRERANARRAARI